MCVCVVNSTLDFATNSDLLLLYTLTCDKNIYIVDIWGTGSERAAHVGMISKALGRTEWFQMSFKWMNE